jgi:signal transduction histidine kinase
MNDRLVMANSRVEWLLNARLQESVGRTMGDVVGELADTVGVHNLFNSPEAHELAERVRENPSEITRRRYTFNQPTFRAIEEISLPVMGHNNDVLGRMFILRDITQEYELESYRNEMSHMLVHDLRSPLGGVITGVHTAMDEIDVGNPPDLAMVQIMLGVALNSGKSLLRLVESILDIHKLETGNVPLHVEPTHLPILAERARTTLEQNAKEANINVIVETPDDLPRVSADADKMERVFINLLDNALRYTPKGGNVWISIECGDGVQMVTIRDSGEGIPAEMWDRIFERFVQADTSRRKRGTKGSGLGLTFCKLAVEAHGGRIWVDAGPEGGAAFHFTLPA